ncbi:SdrD B-like domain protein [uncultured archaeon]|nr:SdrD B-like domain protein [uncultured archaeon]
MIRKLTLMLLLLTVVAVIGISGASAATSSISGFKFNDVNGNGTWDPVEPALPNWTIVLTMPDGSKITNTTNASGFYIFSNLPAGNYTLEEVLQPGWVRTFPKEPIISITLSEGEDMKDTGFGNMKISQATFNISGFKINGDTGNGIQGWNITLSNDTMQTSTLTGTDGSYQFTGLLNGTYNVTEETRSDFTPNGPTSQNVTIADQDITDINFTNTPVSQTPTPSQTPAPSPPSTPTLTTGSISGFKINDLNGNGKWDEGENGLSGWTIQLMDIETHQVRKETATDDQGFYRFENLPAGKYLIEEKNQEGFVPTSSPVKVITLVQGENSINNNFTNRLVLSLVHIDNQRNVENKDMDDKGNINDKKDKGDQGNIKDNKGGNTKDNKDINDHGNIKDEKDLNHKDKGNKH